MPLGKDITASPLAGLVVVGEEEWKVRGRGVSGTRYREFTRVDYWRR